MPIIPVIPGNPGIPGIPGKPGIPGRPRSTSIQQVRLPKGTLGSGQLAKQALRPNAVKHVPFNHDNLPELSLKPCLHVNGRATNAERFLKQNHPHEPPNGRIQPSCAVAKPQMTKPVIIIADYRDQAIITDYRCGLLTN